MDIMTTEQAGKLWGVTPRRVSELCRDGRIKGAFKIGTSWVMPADTPVSYTHLNSSGFPAGAGGRSFPLNQLSRSACAA